MRGEDPRHGNAVGRTGDPTMALVGGRWCTVGEAEPAHDPAADAADTDSTDKDASPLSERDLAVLEFERRWWKHAGAKEQAIRDQFGLSAARYYQVLGRVIESPAAEVHDPMLVRRLQRVRDARLAARVNRLRPR